MLSVDLHHRRLQNMGFKHMNSLKKVQRISIVEET